MPNPRHADDLTRMNTAFNLGDNCQAIRQSRLAAQQPADRAPPRSTRRASCQSSAPALHALALRVAPTSTRQATPERLRLQGADDGEQAQFVERTDNGLFALVTHSLSRAEAEAALPWTNCPKCGAAVKKLTKHLNSKHAPLVAFGRESSTPTVDPVLKEGRPCSCGGQNSNCFRCDGLGVYVVDPPQEKSSLPALGERRPTNTTTHSTERTGFASPAGYFSLGAGPAKLRAPNATPSKRASTQTVAAGSVTLLTCPACRCQVRADRLARHLDRVHAIDAQPRKATAPLPQPGLGGQFPSPSGRSDPAPRRNSRVHAGTPGAKGLSGPVGESTQLDATNLYAHSFRDSGRFGSHASHDDYGEEGLV